MPITHRAAAETDDFRYEAFGAGVVAARAALLGALSAQLPARSAGTLADGASVVAIAPGLSQFDSFDLSAVGVGLASIAVDGPVAYRAVVATLSIDHGWGWADGYGSSEHDARAALGAGLRALHLEIEFGRDRIRSGLDGMAVFPIREGAAYSHDYRPSA